MALLQVEAHPGQFDDVAGGSNYHPSTVHAMRVLLRLVKKVSQVEHASQVNKVSLTMWPGGSTITQRQSKP